MKNKIAIASAFLAASSFSTAEIVINDFLSFEGFVDMSYVHTDLDAPAGNSNSFQIDQVEIDWLFDFDVVTGQIDIDYSDGSGDVNVEQAFVSYHLNDDVSTITAGRYASMLGFEAFEPTGLYQYSTAYQFFGNDFIGTPVYVQGVKYTYDQDNVFFGASLQDSGVNDDYDNNFGGSEGGWGFEAAGSVIVADGLAFFLGGAYQDGDLGDAYVINSYVTFETGAWLFAGELNYGETSPDVGTEFDGFSGLVMANMAYSDQGSVTGRVSFYDTSVDGAADDVDGIAYTFAHGWAFTDNLLLVLEASYVEDDGNSDQLVGAAELLFTF